MGNSGSICADKNATSRFDESGSPVYPTAYNSQENSNGHSPIHQIHQQVYNATIANNEQLQQQHSYCNCSATDDSSHTHIQNSTAAGKNGNGKQKQYDVTNAKQYGISRQQQQQYEGTVEKQPLCFSRSSKNAYYDYCQANKNHTTNTTTTASTNTTTTIEYELSNGIAKLTKISTSRNAVEEAPIGELTESTAPTRPTSATSSSSSIPANRNNLPPLLTTLDLENLKENLLQLQAFNNTRQNSSPFSQHQKVSYSTMSNCFDECARDRITVSCVGDNDAFGRLSGLDRLRTASYNKGTNFNIAERQLLGIHGLLPANVRSVDEQVCVALAQMDRLSNDLDKYIFLISLSERNERLFYRILASNVSKVMPLVYTPTVGLACQNYSLIYQYPKGLFITIKDKGHVYEVLKNWPEKDVRAICVTDGERILGLGDLGANGMGIPVGKLALYTALAGIKPNQLLPVTLDVGTNTKSILEDPFYIGIRKERVTGKLYDEFIDEFMTAAVRRFGKNCLIQFEDFANANAFRLIAKYRDQYCTFNDDIQGTASVALAGILASLQVTKTKLKDNKIVFFGAGEAALGIANLCVMALMKEGLCEEEAKKLIFMVDSRGLIVKDRPSGGITVHKARFAQEREHIASLEEIVNTVQPTILIGAAAIGGAFTKEILKAMAQFNEKPVIFALSNPTSKAECTAEEAYIYTGGKVVFASGSPFGPVEYGNRKFYPGQGNNSYIFPGVALGVICAGMKTIPEEVFYISAKRLAGLVSHEDLMSGSLYPPLKDIQCVSVQIAKEIMTYAFENGLALLSPEPKDKLKYIRAQMYEFDYQPSFPEVYGPDTK